jgi:hypothetical protein
MKMAGGNISPVRKTGSGPPSPATDPFIIFSFDFLFFSSPVIGLGLGFQLKTDFSLHFSFDLIPTRSTR